jgi:hypothetical protein
MWVQDAMVLAATWPRCSDLLGHFFGTTVRPETDSGKCLSPAQTSGPEGQTAAKYSSDRTG